MTPDQFWELTPSELNLIVEVFREKQENEHKNNITYAYYNAYFQRVKNMPKLSDIIEKLTRKDEMTDEDMFRLLKKSLKEGG